LTVVVLVLHGLVHADARARIASRTCWLMVVMARWQHHCGATVRFYLVHVVGLVVITPAWLLLPLRRCRRLNRAGSIPLLSVKLTTVLSRAVVPALSVEGVKADDVFSMSSLPASRRERIPSRVVTEIGLVHKLLIETGGNRYLLTGCW